MSPEPQWISKKALLLLHEESLAEFGGHRGLRDDGLLDSALSRPKNKLAYEPGTSIATLAASYALGLAKNHPFIDGNNRIAFLSMGLFLALNGYSLRASQVDAVQTILAAASGELDEEGLALWIGTNSLYSTDSVE